MVRRVVREARVAPDVVEANRPLLEERAEHTVRAGKLTDRGRQLVADPRGDEAGEPTAAVGNTDRRVARVRLAARRAHDPIEDGIEVRRVAEREQLEDVGGDGIGVGVVPCGHRSCRRCRQAFARSTRARPQHIELVAQRVTQSFDGHANLGHAVALPDGHGMVVQRVEVEGDRQRCADLVLAAVAPSDRLSLVVHRREVRAKVVLDAPRRLGQLGLLGERQHRDLHRRDIGMEVEHDTLLTAHLLLVVRVDEQRDEDAIGAHGRLDDVRARTARWSPCRSTRGRVRCAPCAS